MSRDFRRIQQLEDQRRAAAAQAVGVEEPEKRELTAKDVLRGLAFLGVLGAAGFWYYIFGHFTPLWPVALLAAAGMGLSAPALTAFIIPWSPARSLLSRILGKTIGSAFVIASAMFLVYFAFELLYTWWMSQPGGAVGVAVQMSILMIILFIIIPALLWAPVLSGDLRRMMREEQLVQEYEIYQNGKIALMQETLMRATTLTAKGLANLLVEEKQELAGIATSLVQGMENIQKELGGQLKKVSRSSVPFDNVLPGNVTMRKALDDLADELLRTPAALSAPRDEVSDEEGNVVADRGAADPAVPVPNVRLPEPSRERQLDARQQVVSAGKAEARDDAAAGRRARIAGRRLPRD